MSSKSLWPLICLSLFLAVLVGCGGGSSTPIQPPPPAAKTEFLYASGTLPGPTIAQPSLLAFKLDTSTGTLTATATVPSSSPALPFGFAVDPASRYAYISRLDSPGGSIDIYSLDPTTGVPTFGGNFAPGPVCTVPCIQPFNGPGPLAIDPKGKFLYYGSDQFGTNLTEVVGGMSIGNGGALNLVPSSPFPTNGDLAAEQIVVHPSGQFIYTTDMSLTLDPLSTAVQSISGYAVAADGSLTPVPNSPFAVSETLRYGNFLIHPSGKFLYATPVGLPGEINAWSVNTTTGELTPLSNAPFALGSHFGSGMIHPNGKFLYLSLLPSGTGIGVFSIDPASGSLTLLSTSPVAAGANFTTMTIDPSGQFLFTIDNVQETLNTFKIDPGSGSLTATGTPISIGGRALQLQIVKAP